MNLFLSLLPAALQNLPILIAGVETLMKGKIGADKKAAVIAMLPAAVGVAQAAAPGHAEAIGHISAGAGQVIDGLVTMFNQSGTFSSSGPAAAAAQ